MELIYKDGPTPLGYNALISSNYTIKSPEYKISNLGYAYYTLLMYDPDAPRGNYFHWIVSNIDVSSDAAGTEVLPYVGPSPPKNKIHRYIVEVYGHNTAYPSVKWENENRGLPLNIGKDRLGLDKPILQIMFRSGSLPLHPPTRSDAVPQKGSKKSRVRKPVSKKVSKKSRKTRKRTQ